MNPYRYDVIRNGVLVDSAGWSGGDVTCQIDELEVGSYNMTIHDLSLQQHAYWPSVTTRHSSHVGRSCIIVPCGSDERAL